MAGANTEGWPPAVDDGQRLAGADGQRASTSSPLRSLAKALSLEVSKLEMLRSTAGLVMSLVMVAISASVVARGSTRIGGIGLGVGISGIVWFATVRRLLATGRFRPAFGWVTVVVENLAPWSFYAALGIFGKPASAHHDWGPLLLYCGALVVAILRLNPRYTLTMGGIATAQYLLVTTMVLIPRHQSLGGADGEFRVLGEVTRVLMIFGAAGLVAWVTNGLRGAVGGVVRTMRAADLFGKYRLESELASGGMGVVWRATYCPEGGFARPAAVKLVHAHLVHDPGFIDAFRREASLGARLVHSHIVQVFDFGVVDDRYFLAMEYVDGPTLRDVMHRAAATEVMVPPVVAGAIVRAILAGLACAHSEARDDDGTLLRVIHRDLAPSNILITRGGVVKITDFGIARALRGQAMEATETVAGHLDHMAPEQANAAPLDERTDLFCAGILLWELLVGRPLFRRENQPATLLAITYGEIPSPSSEHPSLAGWDGLLARALHRDPAQRFSSASQMASAIRTITGDAGEDAIARFIAPLLGFSLPDDPDATVVDPVGSRSSPA